MTYYTQALQNVRKLTSTYIINITMTTYFIHSLEARWTLLKCAGELLSLNIYRFKADPSFYSITK